MYSSYYRYILASSRQVGGGGNSREHFLIGQKLSRQNWQSACYRASLIKNIYSVPDDKRIKELKEHVRTVRQVSNLQILQDSLS
jgi:hypothetical protein